MVSEEHGISSGFQLPDSLNPVCHVCATILVRHQRRESLRQGALRCEVTFGGGVGESVG